MHELLLKLISVGLPEVVVSDKVNLELEELKEFDLFLSDLLGADGSVSNLLRDDLRVEREDVLVLAGKVHGSDAENVDVLVLELSAVVVSSDEVLVEESDGQEVSSGLALEARGDFNHPVCHLGAELLRNLVALERVLDGGDGRASKRADTLRSGSVVESGGAELTAGIDELTTLQGLLDILQLMAVEAARISQAVLVLVELSQAQFFSLTHLSLVELLGVLDAVSLVEAVIGRGLVAHLGSSRVVEQVTTGLTSLRNGNFQVAHFNGLETKVLRFFLLLRIERLSVHIPHSLRSLRLSTGRARLVQDNVALGLASLHLGVFLALDGELLGLGTLDEGRVLDGVSVDHAEVLRDIVLFGVVAGNFTVCVSILDLK